LDYLILPARPPSGSPPEGVSRGTDIPVRICRRTQSLPPGRPLAGRCQEAQTFLWEFFLFSFFPSRPLWFADWRAPVFNQLVSDPVGPHQSPIRFKALAAVLYGQRSPPLAILIAPENYRYHAVSKVIGSQIHWLSLFGGQP